MIPAHSAGATTTYARLRVSDPARWRVCALAWRAWAGLAGRWSAAFGPLAGRLRSAWSGAAAAVAVARLGVIRRSVDLFRVLCWQTDQALSEFAGALERARALLARAGTAARRTGATIDDQGIVHGPGSLQVATDLSAALDVAASADSFAAARLTEIGDAASTAGAPPPPAGALPSCAATPAEVAHWWAALTPAQRRWLVVTAPGWLGPLDGVPAAYRDLANRMLLDDQRTALDAAAAADGHERRRSAEMRDALANLAGRLATPDGPRAYLMRLDTAGDGEAVVALGNPDTAAHVLTHVPGMTADLASYGGELDRAERVAVRAAQLAPATTTSAVLWLGYDAPDFLDEAATAGRAEAGAVALRRFQDGLRATHTGPAAQQTVLGHSYGSLVVGTAARRSGLAADSLVFVGSPGVGVDSVHDLRVPADRVWSTTSRKDIIQYLAPGPGAVAGDMLATAVLPPLGPAVAAGTSSGDLWFGENPSGATFGARVFASQPGAGHVGYWDPDGQALDAITAITLGGTP